MTQKPFKRTVVAATALLAAAAGYAESPDAVSQLARMSLEELSSLEVTSVSKSGEALRFAPASIYVITREDIVRAGATSVPEALRLAPNLEIRRLNAREYSAAARGFAGSPSAQNFSNKLLILIDGRSVYSPLFSGVYFDAQDVLLEDIDRIEVISGPGSTLWGANAMNGVINIVTRSSSQTQGAFANVAVGDFERDVGLRYGGALSNDSTFRVYAKGRKFDAFELANRQNAEDDWRMAQGGFRLDLARGDDTLTTQGDAYRAWEDESGPLDVTVNGANLLARWVHRAERSNLQVQAYFDDTQRGEPPTGVALVVHTYDLEVQHSFEVGDRHKFIWGAGDRVSRYGIRNSQTLLFLPPDDTLNVGNVFAQDVIALNDRLQLTLGLKLENDPYIAWQPLPEARLAWRATDDSMLWVSAQRGIRAPTPFDHDVAERLAPGEPNFVTGNVEFDAEKVDAYELGLRAGSWSQLSFAIAAFYNDYDDLRTIETTPVTFTPLYWGNRMRGHAVGIEAWAKWQVTDWWRLSPGVRTLRRNLEFEPGASRLLGLAQAGNDPTAQAQLNSSMTLGSRFTFDVFAQYEGSLPSPHLDAYVETNARIGWRLSDDLELALSGFNLLNPRHRESPEPGHALINRSVLLEARWKH